MERKRASTLARGFMAAVICLAAFQPAAVASANVAPGKPTLLDPQSGATVSSNGLQLFRIRASDPDGDPYTGWVTVRRAAGGVLVTAFRTFPARSGDVATGVPPRPLPSGSYTWTASAADVLGSSSDEATPLSFSVGGATEAGGGPFTGRVSYSPAIPAPGGGCVNAAVSLEGTSVAAVLSVGNTQYAGFLNLTGSGASSACEGATTGTGSLTISAHG
ncbi:MAG: hypothetical protein ACREIV_13560, partial [Planctomycetaceae bacterium]